MVKRRRRRLDALSLDVRAARSPLSAHRPCLAANPALAAWKTAIPGQGHASQLQKSQMEGEMANDRATNPALDSTQSHRPWPRVRIAPVPEMAGSCGDSANQHGAIKMERAMGFEPTTATLARWRSTTELRSPLSGRAESTICLPPRNPFFLKPGPLKKSGCSGSSCPPRCAPSNTVPAPCPPATRPRKSRLGRTPPG